MDKVNAKKWQHLSLSKIFLILDWKPCLIICIGSRLLLLQERTTQTRCSELEFMPRTVFRTSPFQDSCKLTLYHNRIIRFDILTSNNFLQFLCPPWKRGHIVLQLSVGMSVCLVQYQTWCRGCPQWVNNPYWFSGHMFKGQGQTTLLSPLCCLLNIFWPLHLINTKLSAGLAFNK